MEDSLQNIKAAGGGGGGRGWSLQGSAQRAKEKLPDGVYGQCIHTNTRAHAHTHTHTHCLSVCLCDINIIFFENIHSQIHIHTHAHRHADTPVACTQSRFRVRAHEVAWYFWAWCHGVMRICSCRMRPAVITSNANCIAPLSSKVTPPTLEGGDTLRVVEAKGTPEIEHSCGAFRDPCRRQVRVIAATKDVLFYEVDS